MSDSDRVYSAHERRRRIFNECFHLTPRQGGELWIDNAESSNAEEDELSITVTISEEKSKGAILFPALVGLAFFMFWTKIPVRKGSFFDVR